MQRTMLAAVHATEERLIAPQISAHLAFSYTKPCTVHFAKHLSPYAGCISEWIWLAFIFLPTKIR